MKKEDGFEMRAYGRSELAVLYMPHLTAGSAWRTLRQWIARSEELTVLLGALGYDGRQRTFTPAQVEAIVEVLGTP